MNGWISSHCLSKQKYILIMSSIIIECIANLSNIYSLSISIQTTMILIHIWSSIYLVRDDWWLTTIQIQSIHGSPLTKWLVSIATSPPLNKCKRSNTMLTSICVVLCERISKSLELGEVIKKLYQLLGASQKFRGVPSSDFLSQQLEWKIHSFPSNAHGTSQNDEDG